MSLVIAIKDKDRVVLGSDKQSSTGLNKNHTSTKIWPIEKLPGAIMGGVGTSRGNQIIQHADLIDLNELPAEIDTSYLVKQLAPIIMGTLKANGMDCSIPEGGSCTMMPNSYIFAYRDRAWVIYHDQSVEEVEDYVAIGSGSDVANGALFATPHSNPFERIVTSIDAAAETTLFVDDGVDLMMTALRNHDKEQITKALGLEEPKSEVAKPKAKKVKKVKKESTPKEAPVEVDPNTDSKVDDKKSKKKVKVNNKNGN